MVDTVAGVVVVLSVGTVSGPRVLSVGAAVSEDVPDGVDSVSVGVLTVGIAAVVLSVIT